MDAVTIIKVIKILLIVLGGITVVWGIYDMFGDGQQNSSGLKKIMGGVAFAAVAGFVLTWAEGEIASAMSQAGVSGGTISVHIMTDMIASRIGGFF